jgi:hypothetical protein
MTNPIRITGAALLALALAACSTGGTKPDSSAQPSAATSRDKSAPETRAVTRWQLIIDGHAQKAYDYLSPGARSTKSRDEWAKEIAGRPVKWTKVQYLDKACESDDACQVRLQLEYQAPLQGAPDGKASAPGFLTERWIRIDGIWYFLPESFVSGGLH